MSRIVQVVTFIGPGSGIAGVAWNLDQQFRSLGATVETFTFDMARRGPVRPWPRRRFGRRLARAWRVIWFSTAGTVRARRFLAERPDAISICHDNALVGDIYVSHGTVAASMRARGHATWRMLRNPTHVFTFLRDLYRYRSRTHRAVVALAASEAETLRRVYGRVAAPITVISNGVDLERFRPPSVEERQAARALFRLEDDARVALFIGHEFDRKGLSFAIEGLREAPSVLLLIVGGSAEIIQSARTDAQDHGVGERVMFTGPRHDLPTFLAASDMFVLPSAYEANALVILEALASGLPVICTPVGFAPEIVVDGRNGYLVTRDAHEVGRRMDQLAHEDLAPWRANARASAEPHDWRAVAMRYLDLIDDLRRAKVSA